MMAGAELIPEFDDGDPLPSTSTGATGPLGCDAVAKCVATRELVDSLLAAGVPIDGVGFQGHMADLLPSDFRALTAWVGARGLDWALTEADVPMPAGTGPIGAARQADAYAAAADACIDDPACDTIVTWGLSDRYTWWKGLLGGVLPDALPFDEARRRRRRPMRFTRRSRPRRPRRVITAAPSGSGLPATAGGSGG